MYSFVRVCENASDDFCMVRIESEIVRTKIVPTNVAKFKNSCEKKSTLFSWSKGRRSAIDSEKITAKIETRADSRKENRLENCFLSLQDLKYSFAKIGFILHSFSSPQKSNYNPLPPDWKVQGETLKSQYVTQLAPV
jgi:hypothetical protein